MNNCKFAEYTSTNELPLRQACTAAKLNFWIMSIFPKEMYDKMQITDSDDGAIAFLFPCELPNGNTDGVAFIEVNRNGEMYTFHPSKQGETTYIAGRVSIIQKVLDFLSCFNGLKSNLRELDGLLSATNISTIKRILGFARIKKNWHPNGGLPTKRKCIGKAVDFVRQVGHEYGIEVYSCAPGLEGEVIVTLQKTNGGKTQECDFVFYKNEAISLEYLD